MADVGGLTAGTLTVRIVSDSGNLRKDVERSVNDAASSAVKGVQKAGRDVGKSARDAGAKASLFLTAPLLALGKGAADAASTQVEAVNKVNVVFGDAAGSVQRFADTSARAFGISRNEALGAAGTFGNLFRAMGVGEKQAARTSTEMVGLAGDLASFNDANPEDVLEALRAGLIGEAEPMRKFGVQLSEARVQAEAFALGLAKPVRNAAAITSANLKVEAATRRLSEAQKEHGKDSLEARTAADQLAAAQRTLEKATKGNVPALTDQQKLLARQSIITKDTALAQGDFSRSLSTSAANQKRVSKALASDAQATFGAQLLPLYQRVITVLGGVAGAFGDLSPAAQTTILAVGGVLAALGPLLAVLGNVHRAYTGLAKGAAFAGPKLVGAAKGSAAAAKGAADLAHSIGTVVVTYARLAVQQAASVVRTVATTVATNAAALATKAYALATGLLSKAMAFLAANPIVLVIIALVALAAALVMLYRRSETFRKIVNAVFGAVARAGAAFGRAVMAVLSAVGGFLVGRFLGYVRTWRAVIAGMWRAVVALFNAGRAGVMAAVNGLRAVGAVIGGMGSAVIGRIRSMWDTVLGLFRRGRDTVLGVARAIRDRVGGILGAVGGIVEGAFGSVRAAINSIINAIRNIRIPPFTIDPPGPGPTFHFGGLAPFGGIPNIAQGATILPSPGGTLVRVAEAGRAETVVDTGLHNELLRRLLDDLDGRGGTVNVFPQPGMSEYEIGRVAARELEWVSK